VGPVVQPGVLGVGRPTRPGARMAAISTIVLGGTRYFGKLTVSELIEELEDCDPEAEVPPGLGSTLPSELADGLLAQHGVGG
jgi:hypothetical protein